MKDNLSFFVELIFLTMKLTVSTHITTKINQIHVKNLKSSNDRHFQMKFILLIIISGPGNSVYFEAQPTHDNLSCTLVSLMLIF